MQIDTLLSPDWLISNACAQILSQYSLAIDKGMIIDILPTEQAVKKYQATEHLVLTEQVLLPGLINTHTHVAMSLLRGFADDLPLMTWLQQHIWPAEQQWVGEEFVYDGSLLAIAEMLKQGVTCFNDMYFFAEMTAKVVAQTGIRANLGLIVVDFPSAWAKNADDYIAKNLALYQQWQDHSHIHWAWAPHAPYSVSDQALATIASQADQLDIPIHMHVHETQDEINQSLAHYQMRPIPRLQQLGLLSKRLLAVHMTHLTEDEIEQVAENQVQVIHCPQSNLKLASGVCPVAKLMRQGVNIAIGTDSAASNNDLDVLAEIQTAALLAKGVANDASVLPANKALAMATINAASALQWQSQIASLEIGKQADCIAMDMSVIEVLPIYHLLSQLIYASHASQVNHVWVAGKQLVKNKQLLTIDELELKSKIQQWGQRLKKS